MYLNNFLELSHKSCKAIDMWVAKNFRVRLFRLRNERGLSQLALAAKAGLSEQQISDWTGGRKVPSLRGVYQLCAALKTGIADVMGETALEDFEPRAIPVHSKHAPQSPGSPDDVLGGEAESEADAQPRRVRKSKRKDDDDATDSTGDAHKKRK